MEERRVLYVWVAPAMLMMMMLGCVASMKVMPDDKSNREAQVYFKRTAVSVSSSSRSSSSSRYSSNSTSRQRNPGTMTNNVSVNKPYDTWDGQKSPNTSQPQTSPSRSLDFLPKRHDFHGTFPPHQEEPRSPLPSQRKYSRPPVEQHVPRKKFPEQEDSGTRVHTQQQDSRSQLPKQQIFRSPLRGNQDTLTPLPKEQQIPGTPLLRVPLPKREGPHTSLPVTHSPPSSLSFHPIPLSPSSSLSSEDSFPGFSLIPSSTYSISSIRRERGRALGEESSVSEIKQGTTRHIERELGRRERGRRERGRRERGRRERRKEKERKKVRGRKGRGSSSPVSIPLLTQTPQAHETSVIRTKSTSVSEPSSTKNPTPASRTYFTPPSATSSTVAPTTFDAHTSRIFSTPIPVPLSTEVSVQLSETFGTPDPNIYFAPFPGPPSTTTTTTTTNFPVTFATPAPHTTTRSFPTPVPSPVSTNVSKKFATPAPHATGSFSTPASLPLSLQALVPIDASTAPSSLAPLLLASHLASQITMNTGLDHGQDWISLRSRPPQPQTNQHSSHDQIRLNSNDHRGHYIRLTSDENQSHVVHDQARPKNLNQIQVSSQMGSEIQVRVQGMTPRPFFSPSNKKNVQDDLPQQQQKKRDKHILHNHGGILYNVQFWPRRESETRKSFQNKDLNDDWETDSKYVRGDKGHAYESEGEMETSTTSRSKEVIIITGKKVLESHIPSSLPTSTSSSSKKTQRRKMGVERRLELSRTSILTLQPRERTWRSKMQTITSNSKPRRSKTSTSQPRRKKTSTSYPGNQTLASQEQLMQISTTSFPPSDTTIRGKNEEISIRGRSRGLRRHKKHLSHRPLHVLHGPPYEHTTTSLSPGGAFSSTVPPPPQPQNLRKQKVYQSYNTATKRPQDERYVVSGNLKSESLIPPLPVPPLKLPTTLPVPPPQLPSPFRDQRVQQNHHNNFHSLKLRADEDERLLAPENLPKLKLKPAITLQPYFSEEVPREHQQYRHHRHPFPSTAPSPSSTQQHHRSSKPTPSPHIKLPPLPPVRISPTLSPFPTTMPPPRLTSTLPRFTAHPTPLPPPIGLPLPLPPPLLPTSPVPRTIPHLTIPLPSHSTSLPSRLQNPLTSQPPLPPRIRHPTSGTPIPTRLPDPASHHETSLLPGFRHPTPPPPRRPPHVPSSPPPISYPTSTPPPSPLPHPNSTLPPPPHMKPESLGSSVAGTAWVDYPAYATVPRTNFTCTGPGLYADRQAGCQVWHVCEANFRRHSFLCPNGTVFSQHLLTCDWWHNVHCAPAGHNHHHIFGRVLPRESFGPPYNEVLERLQKQTHGEVARMGANEVTKGRSVLAHGRSRPILKTTPYFHEANHTKLESVSNFKPSQVPHGRPKHLELGSKPIHIKGKVNPRVIHKTLAAPPRRTTEHHSPTIKGVIRPSTPGPVVKGRGYPYHSTSRPHPFPSVPFREFVPYSESSYPMFHINRNYNRRRV